ncbi:MAG TPA: RES family NAD+ phosphorylase [Allosphingosinicella sp.]
MGFYDIPNPDDLDPATLSLCVGCAKEPNLKRFVKANVGGGAFCGICLAPHVTDQTCSLERKGDLTNLVKSLIRFHYDESDYNPHWGGEYHPYTLLYGDNPILEHESNLFYSRSRDWSWVFLEDLFDREPYPDPTTGVSIYAGFDGEGSRMLHRAIRRGENWTFMNLRRRLFRENYFNVEPVARGIIERAGARIARSIPTQQIYFRARIGAERFYKVDEGSVAFKPYEGDTLGAPPAPKASSGRLNRAGVAFLYLATDLKTAAAEVRPHPSHVLSIGQFTTTKALSVAAFDVDIEGFVGSEADLEVFDFLFTSDRAMGMPVLPEDAMGYSITQLLADAVRNAGYDGVTFRSSVADGHNLCVFDPGGLQYVSGSAAAIAVTKVKYSTVGAATIPEADAEDYYPVDG